LVKYRHNDFRQLKNLTSHTVLGQLKERSRDKRVVTKETRNESSKGHSNSSLHSPLSILKEGTKAPDFTLLSTPDQKISLRNFRGSPVVLVFYPADWSPVCTDQLSLYNQLLPEFKRYNSPEILAISVDGIWSHLAFAKDRKLAFPLLSDFEPKGEVSRRYGVFQHSNGEAARALFVINEAGVIRWSYLSPVGVNPGADGILRALEEMYPDKGRLGE
jgi:peroxiredoxin